MADPSAEFVSQYVVELQDLTINSKVIINTLTMLASENKQAAAGISEAIERRITTCAPAHKLPALYLLDSIVKNVGLPYTALFARDLPEVYLSAWNALPDSRNSLQKLYNTWHRYFPADILGGISDRVSNDRARVTATQPSTSYAPAYPEQYAAGQPGASFSVQQQSTSPGAWPQYAGQYSNGQVAYPQQPYQQPLAFGQQQQQAVPYTYGQPQQQVYAQAVTFSSTYTPTYPQPQYVGTVPSPQMPISPSCAVRDSPANMPPQPAASSAEAVPHFLSQLIGAGLIPAGRNPNPAGLLGSARGAPSAASFEVMKSKEAAEKAVQKLLEGSQATRAKFLDQRLHKQQKRAAGANMSRQWYTRENDWLAGTTADAQAAPAFFDEPQEEEGSRRAEEEASVPADPSQPDCALSGERFESVWDDAANGWRYKGAAALDAEQAARYGLVEGALVKVSCLGGALELEGATEAVQEAEGEETAKEVAAAAAEETTEAADKADEKGDLDDKINLKRDLDASDDLEATKRQKQ